MDMARYVARAENTSDGINLGLSPLGERESVHMRRNERDAMFYGAAGVKALGGVASGELVRMQNRTHGRMVIVTTQPDQWRSRIARTLGETTQAHVFDVRRAEDRKKATEVLRNPRTDTANVSQLEFVFVLDQIDILSEDRDLGRAIDNRAWRDYGNVTCLASMANTRLAPEYGDFASIVPVDDDPKTQVFGVMLQPINMPDDVHLVRIFS
jgi:hypothetical protein